MYGLRGIEPLARTWGMRVQSIAGRNPRVATPDRCLSKQKASGFAPSGDAEAGAASLFPPPLAVRANGFPSGIRGRRLAGGL